MDMNITEMNFTEMVILGILVVFVAYHHPKLGAAIGVGAVFVALLVAFHPLAAAVAR